MCIASSALPAIGFRLGSMFIPQEMFTQFMWDTFETPAIRFGIGHILSVDLVFYLQSAQLRSAYIVLKRAAIGLAVDISVFLYDQ